jgi:phytoene/squalene synthetase
MTNDPFKNFQTDLGKDFSQILTNPFLDIAARFWDKPRYEAFRICYRSMRYIDDLVDDRKVAGTPISSAELALYESQIKYWLAAIGERPVREDSLRELAETIDRFAIPCWPWERLCKAMIYDLKHEGFASFRIFLRYTEGAAIAPASVFTHLCGLQGDHESGFGPPVYDVRQLARPLALFSYLVHIVRDFQKDQLSGLNYYAADMLRSRSLNSADLRHAAESGEIPDALRDLIGAYRHAADYYRNKARHTLDALTGTLVPRYRLSLEIIYGLYQLVFERINPVSGNFTEKELNPSPAEIQARIEDVVRKFKSGNIL